MTKKSERSLLLWCMLFVFACLLLSGGWRLIGGGDEENLVPVRQLTAVRAVLCQAPQQRPQTGALMRAASASRRMYAVSVPDHQVLNLSVQSDANGNVLAGMTYMRAVYQAFALDDGFV